MKFKLGLVLGATTGYLIGSGKGAEMWADYRARAGGGAGQSLTNTDSLLDFSDPVVGTPVGDSFVSETVIATSDRPLSTDL
jgi:hypothetical protein